MITTYSISTNNGAVPVEVADQGQGHTYLMLHGGAGPQSVAGFAQLLADDSRVLTPTHPGFAGTPRPTHVDSIQALAGVYSGLLDELELEDVTVVGNSIGGWTAAELALIGNPRVGRLVAVDAVGLQIDSDPVVDFFSLPLDQVADFSYYEPDKFRIDLAAMPDAAKALMAGNRAALLAYGTTRMTDPTLLARLSAITVPTLIVWGLADKVVPVEHGRRFAASIPNARLDVIHNAGHLPQLETPQRLLDDIRTFVAS